MDKQDKLNQSSYPETADIETASGDYATRFAGSVGRWMLKTQERITLSLLKDVPATTVLDVGGGHGQLAIPLTRAGYKVTVLGSADSCRERIGEVLEAESCGFVVGNVIDLPFPDSSFDAVIAFRMVTHCSQWPLLLKELCRVSRGPVIVDYPTSQSVNMLAPALFNAKKKVETNTRTWTLFKHRQVYEVFEKNGYRLRRRDAQFFLPMVLHRMLKCATLSAALEGICRALGLTHLLGSPVIICMTPVE